MPQVLLQIGKELYEKVKREGELYFRSAEKQILKILNQYYVDMQKSENASQQEIDILYLSFSDKPSPFVCPICQETRKMRRDMYSHLLRSHSMLCSKEIQDELSLSICSCGKSFTQGRGGLLCRSCANVGANNPVYGKKMPLDVRKRVSEASKKHWEDQAYRDKVVMNATGLIRTAAFRDAQSVRTKQSYRTVPGLRQQRSKEMKKSWDEGRIIPNLQHYQGGPSKMEQEFLDELEATLNITVERQKMIKNKFYDEENPLARKWFIVDGFYENCIIEFFGDYYHANKWATQDEQKVYGISPEEIRERDDLRIGAMEKMGYTVLVVWENQYLSQKDADEFWESIATVLGIDYDVS